MVAGHAGGTNWARGGEPGTQTNPETGAVMKANVGDLLVVPGRESRTGLVIRVLGPDGAPPCVSRGLRDGHIPVLTRAQYARILPPADDGPGRADLAAL